MTQARPRKKRIWLRLVIAMILLAAAVFFGQKLLLIKQKQAFENSYTAFTASIGSISNSVRANGHLELIDSETHTANGAAKVTQIYVSEGQRVREGEKLLRLSNGKSFDAGFDGTVNRVFVEKDDEVARGTELVQIADFDRQKFTVRISEYDIGSVRPGAPCYIDVTSAGRHFKTNVDTVDYISSSNGTVAYYAVTAYIRPDGGVYPGMQATLTVPQAEVNDVVVLKNDAIQSGREGEAFVLVKNAEGVYERRSVETGLTNGNYTEIKSGLEAGETAYAVVSKNAVASMQALMRMNSRNNNNRNRGNWGGGQGDRNGDFGGGMQGR